MQFLNGIKIKPRFIVSIVKQYEPRIIIITTNYEQYTVPTKILLGKNSIYHEEQVLYQSPVHLPRPIGSLKGHGLRQKIQHLFTYILGSSECQSFCRVSSNIHSSEKLGKMYILEALTKYAMFPQKLKSSLFVFEQTEIFIALFQLHIFAPCVSLSKPPVDGIIGSAGNSWRYLSHQGPPQKQMLAKTNKIQIKSHQGPPPPQIQMLAKTNKIQIKQLSNSVVRKKLKFTN